MNSTKWTVSFFKSFFVYAVHWAHHFFWCIFWQVKFVFFFFEKEVKSVLLDWSALCCFVSSFYGVFRCVFIAYHLSLSFSYGGVLPLSIREHCPWWLFCCVGMQCIMCNSFREHCPWSDSPDLDRNIMLPRGIWFLVVFFFLFLCRKGFWRSIAFLLYLRYFLCMML